MTVTALRRVALASASVAALSVGFIAAGSTDASAQTRIYGCGATLPSVIYREVFNCYSNAANRIGTTGNPYFLSACSSPQNANKLFAYASVGSGAGRRAFFYGAAQNPIGPGVSSQCGTPAAGAIPYCTVGAGALPCPTTASPIDPPLATDLPYYYPTIHFAGSDAITPQTASNDIDFDCYNGVGTAANCGSAADNDFVRAGPAIQVPTAGTSVNIPFFVPGRSALQLTRQQLCGIFTGGAGYRTWDQIDPSLPAQPIRVVTRLEGSGTTFLFTQHLNAVCTAANGNPVWTGGVTDAVSGTAWNTSPYFYKIQGSEGIAQFVASVPWSIGYVSPDFTKPALSTINVPANAGLNDVTGANPVSWAADPAGASRPRGTIQNRSGSFVQPNPTTILNSLSTLTPPSGYSSGTTNNNLLNPADWGVRGAQPDPLNPAGGGLAYPIVGFTWFLGYTCYTDTVEAQTLRQWWTWYTKSATGCAGADGIIGTADDNQSRCLLEANQFAYLPPAWRNQVRTLLINAPVAAAPRDGRIQGTNEFASGAKNPCVLGGGRRVGAGQ